MNQKQHCMLMSFDIALWPLIIIALQYHCHRISSAWERKYGHVWVWWNILTTAKYVNNKPAYWIEGYDVVLVNKNHSNLTHVV